MGKVPAQIWESGQEKYPPQPLWHAETVARSEKDHPNCKGTVKKTTNPHGGKRETAGQRDQRGQSQSGDRTEYRRPRGGNGGWWKCYTFCGVLWGGVTLSGFSNRTEEISFLVCELYLSTAA